MRSSKYLLISFLTGLLCCFNVLVSKAQLIPFYTVTPFEEENYFTKTVFPFNPTFIKHNKVKSITLKNSTEIGMNYSYGFNPNGQVTTITVVRQDKEKLDTAFYTRYYFHTNGLLDKKAKIDYRDGIVKVSAYQYDEKTRIDKIQIFALNAQMPNRPQRNDWQGESVPGVDKTVLQGTLPDQNLLNKMASENQFSSWHYRYYAKDKFEAEERTEYFDFLKQNGSPDTCYQKKTFYYLKNNPVALFLHNGCADKTIPSVLYQFKEGLLLAQTEPSSSNLEPKNEKYSYDKNKNLVLMEDIWNGQKTSELIMIYDKKGFLTTIERKSTTPKMVDYFEDRTLKITYSFY